MSKNDGKGKGKGFATSGIPLVGGGMSQIENTSVEPNRLEARNAFKEGEEAHDTRDFEHRDYFGDEEQMDGAEGPFIADKDDEEWSDGLEDEANLVEDDTSDEALYPEIQPLHVDLGATAGLGKDDDPDMILRPDTMDEESDDFTDEIADVGRGNLKNKKKTKKSA